MISVAMATASIATYAQGFYDDDIYYDASKAKKEQAEKHKKAAAERVAREYGQDYTTYGFSAPSTAHTMPGSDTYIVNTGNSRDVDEYNRRYSYGSNGVEQTDSISLNALTAGDFSNTRRIERFYNPEIISGSNDENLKGYYYSTQQAEPQSSVIINLNVDPLYSSYYNNPWSPWNSWGYTYYTPSYWNWGYNPWYGPSWSWNWGWNSWYGPSWSWNWGWGGWNDPWYHPWHPGHGWHPGHWAGHGPAWSGSSWRPVSSGATRPHTPGGAVQTTPGRRPGSSQATVNANGSNWNQSTVGAGRRPSGTQTANTGSQAGHRVESTPVVGGYNGSSQATTTS